MRAISVVTASVQKPSAVAARVQQHDELLERRVARALADAVDRALDLPRARLRAPAKRVGDGEAEVVVAVHARGRRRAGPGVSSYSRVEVGAWNSSGIV